MNGEPVRYTVESARSGGARGTREDDAEIAELQTRFDECRSRFLASAPPSPPPKNEPPRPHTAGCEELHKKISAYASCDRIMFEQRDAMYDATTPIEIANDDSRCKAQSATLTADAKKRFACDISAVGVKKPGPPTPRCAALATRLATFAACDTLPAAWAELLRNKAAAATDPNDDSACAAVIVTFEGYATQRFPDCKL